MATLYIILNLTSLTVNANLNTLEKIAQLNFSVQMNARVMASAKVVFLANVTLDLQKTIVL